MTAVIQQNTTLAADVLAAFLESPDEKTYELVAGQLVEKPMSPISSWVATRIAQIISNFIEGKDLGWTMTEVSLMCFPWLGDHGRKPDVAFISLSRLPILTHQPLTVAPNLVVEVLSPTNRALDVDDKLDEYMQAGVELVWIVNPQSKSVRMYRADGSIANFHEKSVIAIPEILPGFEPSVASFFPPAIRTEFRKPV